VEYLHLPGGDLVAKGLEDLAPRASETAEALLVSIAATRLRQSGVPVVAPFPDAEHRLYELLRCRAPSEPDAERPTRTLMAAIGTTHDPIGRFRLTGAVRGAHYRASLFVMATRTSARAAALRNVAVRLSLLVLLLGNLPGGFAA
jgi:hypothetical protein